jgi:hypothetical protein
MPLSKDVETFQAPQLPRRAPRVPQAEVDKAMAAFIARGGNVKRVDTPQTTQMTARVICLTNDKETGKPLIHVEETQRLAWKRNKKYKFLIDPNGQDIAGVKPGLVYTFPSDFLPQSSFAGSGLAVRYRMTEKPIEHSMPARRKQKPGEPSV